MNTPLLQSFINVPRLYAVGGRDGVSCLKTVEVYDPHTNKWSGCASMSKRRGCVGVAVLGGCLYALGGHDVPSVHPSAAKFDCVERYFLMRITYWGPISRFELRAKDHGPQQSISV